MLNVDEFYNHYGLSVTDEEYINLMDKSIYVKSDRLFVLYLNNHDDPFMWMGHSNNFDGVVFRTNSGYLASMAVFDGKEDETFQAIELCNCLTGYVK
jgi:hypothetical protein